jgi:hypothetical protein
MQLLQMWLHNLVLRQTNFMRYVLMAFFISVFFVASAQDGADRITFSRFNKPKDLALLDTVKSLLALGKYNAFISEEKEVYNKTSNTNKFSDVKKLLTKISNNGSDDISQCFYPLHSINFYKNGRIVKYVLICFDCYGLRFSDERWITKVGNEKKRMDLMEQLKKYFIAEGF